MKNSKMGICILAGLLVCVASTSLAFVSGVKNGFAIKEINEVENNSFMKGYLCGESQAKRKEEAAAASDGARSKNVSKQEEDPGYYDDEDSADYGMDYVEQDSDSNLYDFPYTYEDESGYNDDYNRWDDDEYYGYFDDDSYYASYDDSDEEPSNMTYCEMDADSSYTDGGLGGVNNGDDLTIQDVDDGELDDENLIDNEITPEQGDDELDDENLTDSEITPEQESSDISEEEVDEYEWDELENHELDYD